MDRLFILLAASIPLFYLYQGLTTGEIIIHGFNWSEKRFNRAGRDTQPGTFWGYVLFYVVGTVALLGLALFGKL